MIVVGPAPDGLRIEQELERTRIALAESLENVCEALGDDGHFFEYARVRWPLRAAVAHSGDDSSVPSEVQRAVA
jgi:hypothetical protein